MKKALARDKWDNACETLQEADVLARTGFYKGAISRAFFAMENAARAALALKGQEPRPHSGLIQAFNQQVAGKAGLEESWTSRVEGAGDARNTADYRAFHTATKQEAHSQYVTAVEFLTRMREHLAKEGLEELRNVPQIPRTKPFTPGGDPEVNAPPPRPTPKSGNGEGPDRKHGQKR